MAEPVKKLETPEQIKLFHEELDANYPSRKELLPPVSPPRSLREAAEDFVPRWLAGSKKYVDTKIIDWRRLENLFKGVLPLDYWNRPADELEQHLQAIIDGDEYGERDKDDWQSHWTVAIAHVCLSYADNAFRAIFNSDQWFRVRPEELLNPDAIQESPGQPPAENIEDSNFSTAEKLEVGLDQALKKSHFKDTIYKMLMFQMLYGTVYGQVRWDEKKIKREYLKTWYDPATNQEIYSDTVEEEETLWAHPKLDLIRPDQILPDVSANDLDVQSWTGVGVRMDVPRWQIVQGFREGRYNLNEDEFLEKWPEEPREFESTSRSSSVVATDPDRDTLDSEGPLQLQVWSYYGIIPDDKGDTESVVYLVTETGQDVTPENGIMIGLHKGPILDCGLRPIVCAHYTPWPAPIGISGIEPSLSSVWLISQLTNMALDNLRLTINAMFRYRRGSSAATYLAKQGGGNVWKPGSGIPEDELGKEIEPFQQPQIDFNSLRAQTQFHLYDWQNQLNVGQPTSILQGQEKTASEVHKLAQEESTPVANRLDLFKENFLDPVLTLSLALIQQNTLKGKQIPIKDSRGIEQYVTLTADEIRTGKYVVEATLSRPDQMSLAEAQTIERVLPVLANLQMLVQRENEVLAFTPLLRNLLKKLRVEPLDEILRPLTPQEQAAIQQQMMMQQMQGMGPQGAPAGGPVQGGPQDQIPQPPGGPQGPVPTNDNWLMALLQENAANMEGRTSQL